MAKLFANSGDPDQMPHSVASDLGLHCLPITLLRVSRLQWVKCYINNLCSPIRIYTGYYTWSVDLKCYINSHCWTWSHCMDVQADLVSLRGYNQSCVKDPSMGKSKFGCLRQVLYLFLTSTSNTSQSLASPSHSAKLFPAKLFPANQLKFNCFVMIL